MEALLEFLRDHVFWRRNFHPEDPPAIPTRARFSAEHQAFEARMRRELQTHKHLTLLLLWAEDHGYTKFRESYVRFTLPALLVFLSLMMVSTVKYPTFKKLDFKATKTFTKTLVAVLFMGGALVLREKLLYWVLPVAVQALRPRELTFGSVTNPE